ncbi:hypothetical protein HYC85_016668 [Camellia sinensis]|uniref:Uncharacterized protein n=1 Tax=Camellia sinensis TaxID=4442 RepID=A0A7J7H0G7_CAMSI|nr:hypothetical protein HYC85_016668 [Camellia sinensis]
MCIQNSLLQMLSTVLMPSQSSQSEDIYLSVLSGATYGSAMLRAAIEKSSAIFDKRKHKSDCQSYLAVLLFSRRASKAEIRERKDWVTNALNATRVAMEKGIVPDKKCNRVSYFSYCRGFRCLNTYIGHPCPCDRRKWICYSCNYNCYRNCCR